ncbi:hypothetical protein ACFL60_09705 [Candidatus Omnitrophota bacterium]
MKRVRKGYNLMLRALMFFLIGMVVLCRTETIYSLTTPSLRLNHGFGRASIRKTSKRFYKVFGLKNNIIEIPLRGGARIYTDVTKKELDRFGTFDGHKVIYFDGSNLLSLDEDLRRQLVGIITYTSLRDVERQLDRDFVKEIIKRARKIQNSSKPERIITVVELGPGRGKALDEFAREIEKAGVKNVELIGIAEAYFSEWEDVHSSVTFILDKFENLPLYCSKGTINLMYSYAALSGLGSSYLKVLKRYKPFLATDGEIIHDYRDDHFDDISPGLYSLGFTISTGGYTGVAGLSFAVYLKLKKPFNAKATSNRNNRALQLNL